MYTTEELVRHLSVQSGTLQRYIDIQRIKPDVVIKNPDNTEICYFRKERIKELCDQFDWKEINDMNIVDTIIEYCYKTTMTLSYKPVFLISFFTCMDTNGECSIEDVAEQLSQLLAALKQEKNSFKDMGIDYEEKAFNDILLAVSKKYEFEYPEDKMIALSKRIKEIVDDKALYTDWSSREDIKATLQVDLILLLDEFDYPPVTIDDVYKEVLEQAENFKKYASTISLK